MKRKISQQLPKIAKGSGRPLRGPFFGSLSYRFAHQGNRSGKEVASFAGEEKTGFRPVMSPEGRTVAVTNVRGKQSKLFLFDVAAKKVVNTIPLGEKATMSVTVFSPDGKWIAVSRQVLPENVPEPEAEDVPQPHIHLIEAATGELRETLVAPQCFSWSLCFSPDGRTLASSGLGSVLLWDVANLTGAGTRADQEK